MQETKQKVRPVLDFRELNDRVLSLTGQSMPTCDDSLRQWRTTGDKGAIVDLKRACLQVYVEKNFWCFGQCAGKEICFS